MRRNARNSLIQKIVIAVLGVALIVETAVMIFTKKSDPEENTPKTVINLDATGVVKSLENDAEFTVNSILDKLTGGDFGEITDIGDAVNKLFYSDTVVSAVMSLAYPLLYDTLDSLGMMDFAENANLHPKGDQVAKLLNGKGYTACDKDGSRKNLCDVLIEADSDWDYMNSKIRLDGNDGEDEAVSLWYTIDWNVTDKESFYKAMNDMGEALRGVLEVCLQNKEEMININLADFLLKVDKVDVPLDAARIYNPNEKSGYELCLVYLFNMLGLDEGDYVSPEEFCAYTDISDMWRAMLEPLLSGLIEKITANPVGALTDMLVNFVGAADSGELIKRIQALVMFGDFHQLASTFMGFENGEIFNLGNALIDMIESLGIKLSGSFNETLDSILCLITGEDNADMPDMDTNSLVSLASKATLTNGNIHYKADSKKTVDYLVKYAADNNIVSEILGLSDAE